MSVACPFALRPSIALDIAPLYLLAEAQKDKFFSDYDTFELAYCQRIIDSGRALTVTEYGYPVGVFWFDDIVGDRKACIHMLIHPEKMKGAIKNKLIDEAIQWGFDTFGVYILEAWAMSSQKSAIKLLNRYKFRKVAKLPQRTKHLGNIVNVYVFDLTRKFWENQHGTIQQQQAE